MQAVRRLYLYVMSGITLAVVAYGLVILLRVLLDPLFPGRGVDYDYLPNARQQLSQAIAMLGVGFPAWAVHWWLVQRSLRPGRPERDEERGSAVRATYLTGVLLVSLIAWVNGGISLLHWLGTRLFDATPEYEYEDPLGSATIGAVALLVWLYHGLVRRRDLAAGPVSGPAAFVPRLYLYGVALGALFAAVQAFDTAVGSILFAAPVDGVDGDRYARYYLIERSVAAVGWGLVWLGHWWYASRVNLDSGWRGAEERQSRTRVAAFVAAIVAGAFGTLVSLADAASAALAPLLPDPGYLDNHGIASIAVPLIQAVPWAIVWFGHARALRREPAAEEPERALHQARLVSHGVAAAALAVGGTGAGWLLGYGLDLALGGQRSVVPGGSAYELADWLPLTVLGLGAWAWYWRRVIARRRLDPAGEAGSTIRRAFLFITFGVALVVGIAAAAVILYRFVGIVIGAGLGGNLASELSTPLGALIAAAVALAYHGLQLRGDQRLAAPVRADAAAAAPIETGVGVVPAATAEPAGVELVGTFVDSGAGPVGGSVAPTTGRTPLGARALTLVGPMGADLDAALVAARAALPPGIELVEPED